MQKLSKLFNKLFGTALHKLKPTESEWVLLHDADGPKARCRNIDRNEVDGHVLRHVYCHRLLSDRHMHLVDTWGTRVVIVVVVMLVVVVVGKLNLKFKKHLRKQNPFILRKWFFDLPTQVCQKLIVFKVDL